MNDEYEVQTPRRGLLFPGIVAGRSGARWAIRRATSAAVEAAMTASTAEGIAYAIRRRPTSVAHKRIAAVYDRETNTFHVTEQGWRRGEP